MESKYFIIQEYVPKIIYAQYSANSIWFVDPRLIKLDNFIREWFDVPITINNWHTGGAYNNSGFRTPTTKVGSKYSQHRFGRASDKKFGKGLSIKFVFDEIMKYETIFFNEGLRVIENIDFTPTWLHSDVRETELDKILIVNP